MDQSLIATALESKAWPFQEAKKIINRLKRFPSTDVILETGYGASGLPHVGTFGEVARTSMVQFALRVLEPDIESSLLCFSDDMDGLRKVPKNFPNRKVLEDNLEKPLSSIPDPFGEFASFADYNNNCLKEFLDRFGFDYHFISSTDYYKSGKFDKTLIKVLENYENILDIVLPTIGDERKKTYSPFLPICPETGKVLMVKVVNLDKKNHSIIYIEPNTKQEIETSILGGNCKLQWKADWAMRWVALEVDYEMAGKDLIESVNLSGRICKAIGGTPPEGFNYELFFDEKGEKISKSKGNGITIDEWLKYASTESLSLYMYQNPKRAKKLTFDVIPKAVDEYHNFLTKFSSQETKDQLNNPVFYIHKGDSHFKQVPVSFLNLLNLVNASQADSKEVIWGFIREYYDDIPDESEASIDNLVSYSLAYYKDFILPTKKYRKPEDREIEYLIILKNNLKDVLDEKDSETIQSFVYQIGKETHFESLKDWFQSLYEILLGQSHGPRLGSFITLYGIEKTINLIDRAINGDLK